MFSTTAYHSSTLWPSFIFGLLTLVGVWASFMKAGRPGWWAIIPFVNSFVLCKLGGKPGWWFILFIIPIVNIVIAILVLRGSTWRRHIRLVVHSLCESLLSRST